MAAFGSGLGGRAFGLLEPEFMGRFFPTIFESGGGGFLFGVGVYGVGPVKGGRGGTPAFRGEGFYLAKKWEGGRGSWGPHFSFPLCSGFWARCGIGGGTELERCWGGGEIIPKKKKNILDGP